MPDNNSHNKCRHSTFITKQIMALFEILTRCLSISTYSGGRSNGQHKNDFHNIELLMQCGLQGGADIC